MERDTARELAGYRALLDRAAEAEFPPDARERVQDRLRRGEVAEAYAAARKARATVEGEPARFRFRCLSRLYLDRACLELDRELAGRRRATEPPPAGYPAELATRADPVARLELYADWSRREANLLGLREERLSVRDAAARDLGAGSVSELLSAEQPGESKALAAGVERVAIEPLDDAIGSAARLRRARSSLTLNEPDHPADGAGIATLAEHRDRLPPADLPALLRRIGGWVGADPDRGRLTIGPAGAGGALPLFELGPGDRGTIWPGAVGGPLALAAGLACLGRAVRADFLLKVAGVAAIRWSDPAFAEAVALLFARLVFSEEFRTAAGMDWSPAVLEDLHLEQALAPRLAWTYLCHTGKSGIAGSESAEAIRRATGRPATLDQLLEVGEAEPDGAAILRGSIFGLLLEESMLTRFGHGWYRSTTARRSLFELWEVEPGESVENMAAALGLGTIEPTPLLDRCRPERS